MIELIIRLLIAMFTGSSEKRPAPPRSLPKIPPIRNDPAQLGQQQQRRFPPTGQQAANRQRMMRQGPARQATMRPGQAKAPPPIPQPRPAAPPARPMPAAKQNAPIATATAGKPPAITAAAVRQLMLSRRSAMRTIYVLSEVIGPPLGLRD